MMFRHTLIISVLLCSCCFHVLSQAQPKTYALVIGISGYESKDLRTLEYSDKDARLFAA